MELFYPIRCYEVMEVSKHGAGPALELWECLNAWEKGLQVVYVIICAQACE